MRHLNSTLLLVSCFMILGALGCSGNSDTFDAGPSVDRTACQRYLTCAGAVSPGELPSLQQGYGTNGSCWAEGDPALCEEACLKGLSQLRAGAHGEPSCACEADDECLEAGDSYCDSINRQCGTCRLTSDCTTPTICFRSPEGTQCGDCDTGALETEVCGFSSTSSPELWTSSHACVTINDAPTCVECSVDEDCDIGSCDLASNRCEPRAASCTGIWECIRHSPIECLDGDDCCRRQKCPQIDGYLACMTTNCAGCVGGACIGCSIDNCMTEYDLCDSTCL